MNVIGGTNPKAKESSVACRSCTACCHQEAIILVATDDARLYPEAVTVNAPNPITGAPVTVMIPHRPDGACIYLGSSGCTIYDKRPKICRVFSCVEFAKDVIARAPKAERKKDLKSGKLDREIWEAGSSRLKEIA